MYYIIIELMIKKLFKNKVILLFFLIFFVFLFTLKGNSGNFVPPNSSGNASPPFETSLERGRYAQIYSLVNYHTFNVDKYPNFLKPDYAWFNGHYYPAFPVGVSVLTVPAFILGSIFKMSQLFVFANTALTSLLVAVLIFLICRKLKLSEKAGIFAALCYGISSVALPYSVSLSAHPFSALCLCLLIYLYLSLQNDKYSLAKNLLMFAVFGINVFIDYPNLAILLPIVFFAVLFQFKISETGEDYHFKFPFEPFFGMVALLPILFMFAKYNLSHYLKPIAFSNTYNLQLLDRYGIKVGTYSNSMFKKLPYNSRFGLGMLPRGIFTLLISQDRGLLFFSPVYIFGFLGFWVLWKKRLDLFLIFGSVIFMNLLVYGAYDDPWGGWSFGPRYLIISLPILAICVGYAFDFLKNKAKKWRYILFGLFVFSFGVALLGALTTNAVPPSIEAVGLHLKDNYFYNLDYLLQNGTSSFVYNTIFSKILSPVVYGGLVFLVGVVGSFFLVI
jgi:hypothetical protein